MPSILRIGSYVIYFWSNELNEPIHVHVNKGVPCANATKVWLTSSGGCVLANNNSKIPAYELNNILKIISDQFFLICGAWKEHFGDDSVKFYC
ncbi:MAG: DUF4160 domain-containing protein [Treponema sp.]|nr:DUF4160 domain-containing protein [Treponema sp.]